jgi:DNA-binding NarL/FixJ family response regulator
MRIAIVAPAVALRAGLRAILHSQEGSMAVQDAPQVVFEAASLAEYASYAPQVELLILSGETISAVELEGAISQAGEGTAVLVISDQPQAARLLKQLEGRAWGILPLDASAEELLAAVQALNQGLIVGAVRLLAPVFSETLVEAAQDDLLPAALTERESQVLQLLAQGLANKQIALKLGVSEHTVKFHISSIYGKLEATNRTEAVRLGVKRGLISL